MPRPGPSGSFAWTPDRTSPGRGPTMADMHVDHLSYAAEPEGLQATADRLSELLGVESTDGGFHARFGTRNRTIALNHHRYLEIVEVLDHPAAEKAPFGQVVRARSARGGGWVGWVIRLVNEKMSTYETRLGRSSVTGTRTLPEGTVLEWRQLGVLGTQSDPQLPFFVEWMSDPQNHPSGAGSAAGLLEIELAGHPQRLNDWLGESAPTDVKLSWLSPNGQPGIASAVFNTDRGLVRI